EGFGRAEWKEFADMGWLGIALPEEAGGSAGGMTELGIVMAAAGRFILLEPFLGTVVLAATPIEKAGTAKQREVLADVAAGKQILAFCHAEPGGGYARDWVKAVATRDGAGYSLTGEKVFVVGAHAADKLIVSARIGSESGPIGLFLVPRAAEG